MSNQKLREELDSRGIDYPQDAKTKELKKLLKDNQGEAVSNDDPGDQKAYMERPKGTNTNVNTTSEDFDPFTEVQSYGVSDPKQVNKGEREYNPFSPDRNHDTKYTGKEGVPETPVNNGSNQ